MKKQITLALSLALATGCTTFDPYTGEEKTSNTAKGAGIGAGTAAVVAYLANLDEDDARKRNQRILRATAGGAAVGAGIGYYMDTQEAKLRKQLRDTGVSVVRDGDTINLVMPGNITFATNSSELRSDFEPVLDSVALVLEEYNRTIVVVSGHTDSDGSTGYNQALSEQRASAGSLFLRSKGIMRDRLEVIGFGETKPIASNQTAAGKSENRRVEITLIPIQE